ncbi:STAS domain-containing protein [Kitasatospora sp. NPDC018619]|uniref:STAS domain-containing protein n=1 Tax=unclassified Kitasatospora TaxID=2633591 RepID=UPI003796645C
MDPRSRHDLAHSPPGAPERAFVGVPPSSSRRLAQRAAQPCLRSRTVRVGDALVCCFDGDLTLDSEPVAAGALDAALRWRPALLAVDLARVELFTSTGLNLLLGARRRALADGVRLVLVAPSERTLRVLELTETAGLFAVHPTVGDALRHRPPPVTVAPR